MANVKIIAIVVCKLGLSKSNIVILRKKDGILKAANSTFLMESLRIVLIPLMARYTYMMMLKLYY